LPPAAAGLQPLLAAMPFLISCMVLLCAR
jgi:hypothetical protein